MEKVPQEVPVAKARNTATRKMIDRQQVLQGGSGAAQQVGNVIFCTQQVGHAGKRPGQGQDQHGADHGLEALGDAGGKILERHHAADTVEHKGEHQGNAAAQHQTGGGVAVGEGGDEVHALKEAAGVDQAKDAGRDQHQHRGHQINDMAVGIVLGIHIVAVGAVSVVKRSPARALSSCCFMEQ